MPNPRVLWLILAALLLTAPTLASAGVRPWLSGHLGGSTYSMEDVNDDIGEINSSLAGSGLSMDEITKGFNFGAAFGLDVPGGFAVGVAFDRLTGSSEVGDWSGSIEYDLPANLLRGFGRYSFQSAGKAKAFLEASLGRVMSASSVSLSITDVGSESVDLEGSGMAFEGAAGVSIWTTPQFAITAMAGYRKATVNDVEVDGVPIYNTSGGSYSIDYSGAFVRAGLTVALTQ